MNNDIKPEENVVDAYANFIKSLKLNFNDSLTLETMLVDIYIDGWTDGNAHKSSLNPQEHRERLTEDLTYSWTKEAITKGLK